MVLLSFQGESKFTRAEEESVLKKKYFLSVKHRTQHFVF